MADHDHSGHDEHGEHEHHADHTKLYMVVFAVLCVLTGASFFTYSEYWPFHATPQVGWAFMMAVSCAKASLVMLFFMHLKYEANWKYVLTIPAGIMAIFLMLALVPDVGWRYVRIIGGREITHEQSQFIATPETRELMQGPGQVHHESGDGHGSEGH